MISKKQYIDKCAEDIRDATKRLDTTNDNIEETQKFIARRKADLGKNQKDLETEHEDFDEITRRYEELIA